MFEVVYCCITLSTKWRRHTVMSDRGGSAHTHTPATPIVGIQLQLPAVVRCVLWSCSVQPYNSRHTIFESYGSNLGTLENVSCRKDHVQGLTHGGLRHLSSKVVVLLRSEGRREFPTMIPFRCLLLVAAAAALLAPTERCRTSWRRRASRERDITFT